MIFVVSLVMQAESILHIPELEITVGHFPIIFSDLSEWLGQLNYTLSNGEDNDGL